MKTVYTILIFFLFSLMAQETKAQDFVFTFTNPAFGGNPYNYSWLMESANKQNKYDDEEEDQEQENMYDDDPLKRLQDDLNYSILNSLNQKINSDLLDMNADLQPGVYNLGNYTIRITEKATGLNINIKDQTTGGSTNMLIPK
eukprot:Anaeramoba_ignava/a612646_5.p1 GENE.a612646_5~~a612646_5.p1  ORF type:complete len:143 (+),score=13.48 a612646_5:453-881(+)